jgi:glycosyltransferase involved in cell wall biosynthesis
MDFRIDEPLTSASDDTLAASDPSQSALGGEADGGGEGALLASGLNDMPGCTDLPARLRPTFPEKGLSVLVCAHELSPYQGSECAVGWNIVTRLALRHKVTALCASGSQSEPFAYREAIEDYVEKHGPIGQLTLVFVDQPLATRLCAALNRMIFRSKRGVGFQPLFWLGLRAWQRAAYKRAAALAPERFDIVHHLTPIAYWAASTLWRLGRPYVWGPVTGVGGSSIAFARWLGTGATAFETCRLAFNKLQILMSFPLKRGAREASLVYTITSDDARVFGRLGKVSVPMLETAASPQRGSRVRRYTGSRPLRICWSGAHVNRKALPLLFRALAEGKLGDRVALVVVGQGPKTSAWTRVAQKLGLDNVVWRGHLAQSEALEELRRADVFVHTSVREGTPHVVLEAMSLGLPIVCHDAFGMGAAVTDECGVKVPLVSPERSIEGFRAAIERFVREPALVASLSAGALRRASELSWDGIVERISADYTRLAECSVPASCRGIPDRTLPAAFSD